MCFLNMFYVFFYYSYVEVLSFWSTCLTDLSYYDQFVNGLFVFRPGGSPLGEEPPHRGHEAKDLTAIFWAANKMARNLGKGREFLDHFFFRSFLLDSVTQRFSVRRSFEIDLWILEFNNKLRLDSVT